MAKKNIVKIQDLHHFEIKPDINGKNIMTLTGRNSNGTSVSVTIVAEDYFMPHIIENAYKAAKEKNRRASVLLKQCKDTINEINC